MLFLLAAWAVLIVASGTIGTDVLRLTRSDRLPAGDRLFLAVWVGVVALSLALLAVSLVSPLTPGVGAFVAVLLGGSSRAASTMVARRRSRAGADWRAPAAGPTDHAVPPVRPSALVLAIGTGLVALGAAALASDPVTLYDSLVYHVGIGTWLREHGSVFGTALLHNRLGHVSAWFALSAPFDAGPFVDRAWTVGMGLSLVLVGVHGALGTARIAARVPTAGDWLIALCALALVWPVVAYGAATPSPDVAANVLIVLVAWAMCVTARAPGAGGVPGILSPKLVPFVLAAGATAVKLFALPAAIAAALFYIRPGRDRYAADSPGSATPPGRDVMARAIVCAGAGILIVAPLVAVSFVTSGCPLFPSPLGCLESSWSIGADAARDYSIYIRDVARWETRAIPQSGANAQWIRGWVGAHPVIAALLVAAPVLAAVAARGTRSPALRTGLLMSMLGIGFAAWQAPAPRFFYGYLVLVPAILIAGMAERTVAREASGSYSSETAALNATARRRAAAIAFLLFAAGSGLAMAVASQKANLRSALAGRGAPFRVTAASLLRPDRPEGPSQLSRRRINDILLHTPVPAGVVDTLGYRSVIDGDVGFEKCATAPLPCTPYLPDPAVRLRDPRRGLRGGFVRDPRSLQTRGPQMRSRSSSPTRMSRGLEALGGPSTPAAWSWSMMRAARP